MPTHAYTILALAATCWPALIASTSNGLPAEPHIEAFTFRCDAATIGCSNDGVCRQYGVHYQACDCAASWSGPTCDYSANCNDPSGTCNADQGGRCNSMNHCECMTNGTGPHCMYRSRSGEAYDAQANTAVTCNTGKLSTALRKRMYFHGG